MTFDPIPGYEPSGYGDPAPTPDTSPDLISPGPAAAQPPPLSPLQPLPAPSAPTADPAASRRAGAAVVLAGVGIGTGALLGGLWGAGSGLFFSGAAMNALRARSLWVSDYADDRKEAIKTTVMAVLGVAAAGYLGYRAKQAKDDE
jgi:hypothetical protein